jgi:DNA-binding MarR family transcriptional regulator
MKKSRSQSAPAAPWTFFTNHSHVLICLYREPDLAVKEIALRVGITERAVLRILGDLETEGYLKRERVGRNNRYSFQLDKPLRHPIEAHAKIKAVIKAL